jgi:hypothetical protein
MRTLSEAMESLVRRGYTEHFGVRGDQLRGFESGKTFGSQDVIIREYERFEGVSDAFGVYSNPAISAYLRRVRFVQLAR